MTSSNPKEHERDEDRAHPPFQTQSASANQDFAALTFLTNVVRHHTPGIRSSLMLPRDSEEPDINAERAQKRDLEQRIDETLSQVVEGASINNKLRLQVLQIINENKLAELDPVEDEEHIESIIRKINEMIHQRPRPVDADLLNRLSNALYRWNNNMPAINPGIFPHIDTLGFRSDDKRYPSSISMSTSANRNIERKNILLQNIDGMIDTIVPDGENPNYIRQSVLDEIHDNRCLIYEYKKRKREIESEKQSDNSSRYIPNKFHHPYHNLITSLQRKSDKAWDRVGGRYDMDAMTARCLSIQLQTYRRLTNESITRSAKRPKIDNSSLVPIIRSYIHDDLVTAIFRSDPSPSKRLWDDARHVSAALDKVIHPEAGNFRKRKELLDQIFKRRLDFSVETIPDPSDIFSAPDHQHLSAIGKKKWQEINTLAGEVNRFCATWEGRATEHPDRPMDRDMQSDSSSGRLPRPLRGNAAQLRRAASAPGQTSLTAWLSGTQAGEQLNAPSGRTSVQSGTEVATSGATAERAANKNESAGIKRLEAGPATSLGKRKRDDGLSR